MINKIINLIFSNTSIFDSFRNFVHDDFSKEKTIISTELNVNQKTLDFGCGTGQYAPLFDKKYYLGIDIEEGNIAQAQKHSDRSFKLIKSFKDLEGQKFDQVFITMALHHVTDQETQDIFHDMHNSLSYNGKVLIIDHVAVRSQPNPIGLVMLHFDRGKYPRNVDQLKKLFDPYFTIVKQYYYHTGPYKEYVLLLKKKN